MNIVKLYYNMIQFFMNETNIYISRSIFGKKLVASCLLDFYLHELNRLLGRDL